MTCVGYPLQVMVVFILKGKAYQYNYDESSLVNIIFRIVYLTISLYLILKKIFTPKKLSAPIGLIAFILFWLIYSIRLFYDLEIRGLAFMSYSKYYVYSWAFGCTFLPALAVLLNANKIVISRFTKYLFLILLAGNLFIAASLMNVTPKIFSGILSSRIQLYEVRIGSTWNYLLNSISISYYGELLCLIAVVFLIVYYKVISLKFILLVFFASILGVFNLLAGASRGPMIFFIFILLLIIVNAGALGFKKLIRRRYFGLTIISLIFIIVSVIIGTTVIVRHKLNISNIMIQNRMSALLELPVNGKNYDRIYMWESAWQQFKSSPVLGDRFINNIDKTYSHNIILDSLMSTGLLGTIPFLFYLAMPFLMFYKLNKTRKRQLLIVFILFLATFMLSMTSGGLFTVSEFWILSALIIGLCSSPKTLKLTT